MQFLTVLLFCPLISALAFAGPEATTVGVAIKLHPQGWSSRPTKAPEFKDLLKRQSSGSLTLIEGPDSVCGYQFGSSRGELGLCGTRKCGFATASGLVGGLVCFDYTTTFIRPPWTSCVGSILAISCLADSACANNPGIIACTGSEYLCNVATWVGLGIEAVWCDSTAQQGEIPVSTTYSGQIGRAFTTFSRSVPASSTSASSISTSPTSSSTTSVTTSASTSHSQTSTSPVTTLPPDPVPAPSTPTGAIVGGLIGGLAVLAAIAAGIFFCLRSKRRDQQNEPIREIRLGDDPCWIDPVPDPGLDRLGSLRIDTDRSWIDPKRNSHKALKCSHAAL